MPGGDVCSTHAHDIGLNRWSDAERYMFCMQVDLDRPPNCKSCTTKTLTPRQQLQNAKDIIQGQYKNEQGKDASTSNKPIQKGVVLTYTIHNAGYYHPSFHTTRCHKYQDDGHVASNCKRPDRCGKYAGSAETDAIGSRDIRGPMSVYGLLLFDRFSLDNLLCSDSIVHYSIMLPSVFRTVMWN